MSENQEHDMTPGIISWNELATNDPEGSRQFYTQLFGWNAEVMNMGPGMDYTLMKLGDRAVGGMMQMPPEAQGAPTQWMPYVTVTDLPAAVEKAKSLGAKICKEITTIPMGSFSIISDPQGATIGLWQFPDSE